MSLEQAISDHASALRELAAAIRGTISTANGITATTDKVIGAAKTAAAATTKEATTTSTTQAETKKPAETKATPAAEAMDYKTVQAKLIAVSKEKGRDQLLALLQRHGVANGKELVPAQYADVAAQADAIIAGTYDAIVGEPA